MFVNIAHDNYILAGVTPSKMQSYKLPLNDQEKPLPIIILFRNLNFILKLIHVICYFENKSIFVS